MRQLTKDDLLSCSPIPFHGFLLLKPRLKDIDALGFSHFNQLNGILTLSEDDLIVLEAEQKDIPVPTTDPYLYTLLGCQNPSYFLELRLALFTYFQRDIKILEGNLALLAKDKTETDFIFDSQSFFEFQSIIRQLNRLEAAEEPDFNSSNSAMVEKFKEARKKLRLAKARERKKKSQNGEGMTITTMMLALCTMLGYTMADVLDLTVNQLFALFEMCQRHENYQMSHRALCAGAKVKLKYWID